MEISAHTSGKKFQISLPVYVTVAVNEYFVIITNSY